MKMRDQILELQKALEFYALAGTYKRMMVGYNFQDRYHSPIYECPIEKDCGELARKTLESVA